MRSHARLTEERALGAGLAYERVSDGHFGVPPRSAKVMAKALSDDFHCIAHRACPVPLGFQRDVDGVACGHLIPCSPPHGGMKAHLSTRRLDA